jgi:hypothetical protein
MDKNVFLRTTPNKAPYSSSGIGGGWLTALGGDLASILALGRRLRFVWRRGVLLE